MSPENGAKEWNRINNRLCKYLGICSCQRKVKSFINILVKLYNKRNYLETKQEFTMEEYMILAFLDSRNLIEHGINCEYPIIVDNEFWDWVNEVKDNPALKDA